MAEEHEHVPELEPRTTQATQTNESTQPKKKGKDAWEKFSSLSTLISTILIAAVGGYFTHRFNAREAEHQHKIQETDTITKLMPYLTSGKENERRMALVTINVL